MKFEFKDIPHPNGPDELNEDTPDIHAGGGCFGFGDSSPSKSTAGNIVKNKIIQQLSTSQKKSETWIVSTNNGDGTYDLQRTQISDTTLHRVPVISPRAVQMQPGQTVIVRYDKFGVAYIKGPSMQGNQPLNQSSGPIVINILAGMWIQAGAYFWSSWLSYFDNQPLPMVAPTSTRTETFLQSLIPGTGIDGVVGPWTIDFEGITVYVVLEEVALNVNITINSVTINGSAYTGSLYYDPTRQVVSVEPDYSAVSATQYGDVTSFAVNYTYPTDTATQLFPQNVGASGSISPRGVLLFPDTHSSDQLLALVEPVYVANGTDEIPTDYSETLTVPSSGTTFALNPTYDPFPTSSVTIDLSAIRSVFFSAYGSGYDFNYSDIPYINGDNISVLYCINNGDYYSGNLDVSYTQTTTGPVSTADESYTAGLTNQAVYQCFVSDGTTLDFNTVYSLVNGINQSGTINLTTNTNIGDFSSWCTGTDTYVHIYNTASGWPVPAGNLIQFQFYATTGLTVFTTQYPISSLNYVNVNGTPDPLATFSGDVVTLSASCSPGDTVEVNYQWAIATGANYTDTFAATSTDQYSFTLSHTPDEGSISIPSSELQTAGLATNYILSGPSNNILNIALQLPASSSFPVSYTYNAAGNNLYLSSGMLIQELDTNANTTTNLSIPFVSNIDVTPLKLFTRDITIPMSYRWTIGWQSQRWGYAFYDTLGDCYTIACPVGLAWRSRQTGTTSGTNYNLTPWPTEPASVDYFLAGFSTANETVAPLAPGILRKTAPWHNFSAVANYAYQGGWCPVGPNWLSTIGGTDYKAFSDTDCSNYFWQRTANVWAVATTVSVKNFVKDNAGANPLYICGSGIIHQEAQPVDGTTNYCTARTNIGQLNIENSWSPWTSDASAVLVAASWCENNWGYDPSSLNTQDNYIIYPLGRKDAGLTLTANDPSGNLVSHLTFKPSTTYAETAFEDPTASVAYQVAHASDFISSYGINTYYSQESQAEYSSPGNSGYCAIPGESGTWFTCVLPTSVDGDSKPPLLQYPGLPNFSNQLPKYSCKYLGNSISGPYWNTYGSIYQEDNYFQTAIAGDGDDNFYFVLSIPYWVRIMDQGVANGFTTVSGTAEVNISYRSNFPQVPFLCPGYASAPYNQVNSSAWRDFGGTYVGALSSYLVDNYPNSPYPTFNGVRCTTVPYFPYSGTEYFYEITAQLAYGITTQDPETGIYSAYGTLLVPQTTVIPNPSATLIATYLFDAHTAGGGFGGTTFGDTGIAQQYLPVQGPYLSYYITAKGAAVFSLPLDNRQVYDTNARTFLYVVNASKGQLTLLSTTDISHKSPAYANDTHSNGRDNLQGYNQSVKRIKGRERIKEHRPIPKYGYGRKLRQRYGKYHITKQ